MTLLGPTRLVAERVTKVYRSGSGARTVALADMSLTVSEGEFVSIVGPSGCGKSTFLHCVAGLLPYESGTLHLDDQPIVGPGPDRAVVFQDPSLLPWRTTSDNIGYGMALQGRKSAVDRRQKVDELVDFVGLRGFERHYPGELSGGMRQRVNLARALATEPRLLLMDEPFGALDAQTREQMQTELARIWQDHRITVVFITHDIEEAIFLSDRAVVMTGRPGTVRDVVSIDLVRPREPEVKRSEGFLELERYIWELLHRPTEVSP